MTSPFDIVKHLNEKTSLDYDMKDYNPWLINRAMSNSLDTIFFANYLNENSEMPKEMQRDFYFHGIPKGRRYGKWSKLPNINILALIQELYQCNRRVAESYSLFMNEEQEKKLRYLMTRGVN